MKALKNKTNTVPPGGDYPYGDLRDNPGDNSGTPVNRDLMGDIHRTVEKIMDEAGIVANGLDDNEANGYQIYEAILRATRGYILTSFIFDVNDTGNEVKILEDGLNLGYVSYAKGITGTYNLTFTDTSAINSDVIYSVIGAENTGGLIGALFIAGGTPMPFIITSRDLTGAASDAFLPNSKIVVEIRKYI